MYSGKCYTCIFHCIIDLGHIISMDSWKGDVFRQKIEGSKEEIPEDVDFMTFMILSGKMSRKELAMNTIDLISAGVESVSNIIIEGLRTIVD